MKMEKEVLTNFGPFEGVEPLTEREVGFIISISLKMSKLSEVVKHLVRPSF